MVRLWLCAKGESSYFRPVIYAVLAAVFYALNVPCSKMLLQYVPPVFMAGFLYIGAGLGVGVMYLFRYKDENPADRLTKSDLPYTVGMVVLDIAAPILLMFGVKYGNSSNASLLGNFEIVATAVIALTLFREKVSGRLWAAIAFITASSIILSFENTDGLSFSLGSVLVLGATVCWGLENNCTRRISEKSTYQIVTIKGLCSGAGSLALAAATGEEMTEWRFLPLVLALGVVAYGLSIFTYIRAQKDLGAAKTSAYYAVAPFIGAFLSFLFLDESLSVQYLVAFAVMIAGTWLVVTDTLRNGK
jgi:drug/metabolite transporter (DMT)-like permease